MEGLPHPPEPVDECKAAPLVDSSIAATYLPPLRQMENTETELVINEHEEEQRPYRMCRSQGAVARTPTAPSENGLQEEG